MQSLSSADPPPPHTALGYPIGWDVECGDGWFDLLDELCARIQAAVDAGAEQPRVLQVKEKFVGLRFYVRGADGQMETWIDEAEARSCVTCEVCGASGVLRRSRDGWLGTRCDAHAGDHSRVVVYETQGRPS